MDVTIQGAIIGAVAGIGGATLGAIAAWLAASSTNRIQRQISQDNLDLQRNLANASERAQRWSTIEAQILKLTEFAMKYPALEKDAYCSSYPNCVGDPNGKERYENYCVYVFNTLASIWEYCDKDIGKVRERFADKEVIRKHYRCWLADHDNLEHDEDFRQYVQSVIDQLRREGKVA